MVNIGVIGCGHWGPNHVRVFSTALESQVVMCADLDGQRLRAMKQLYPHINTTKDVNDIFNNEDIHAVVVATPTATHYEIVKQSLSHGKDVLCEKPLTTSIVECEELVKLAERMDRILMVGHIFIFNSGIQKLHDLINNDQLGKIYYIRSERTNLGPFREDVNAVWDLASHDVSIFSYLLDTDPICVMASGESFLQPKLEDVAFISFTYPEHVLANIHVSWLDPRKVRQITVVGDKKMVIWDDLDNLGPIKIYDKGVVREPYYDNFGEFQLLAREGDLTIPKIRQTEPLKSQSEHFLDCVKRRKKPLSDGIAGLKVVRILSTIQASIVANGAPQTIEIKNRVLL